MEYFRLTKRLPHIPEVETFWEVTPHLGQELLALDSDSEMVVGRLVLCRMDRACAEGGRGWIKLKARKFLPLRESSPVLKIEFGPPHKFWVCLVPPKSA